MKPKKPKAQRVPNPCYGASLEKRWYDVKHYAVRLPFTPSNNQLKKYALHQGHELVINWLAEPPAPTFNEDAVRTLKRKYKADRLYPLLEEYRSVEKLLGTYVQGMIPDADGRIRGTYNHNPKTLRKAMKDPSLQVIPRASDEESLASRIKEYFIAAPGHRLLSRDYGGIEAQIVAYLANDRQMLRLTKIDIHGFIASHAIGQPADLSWTDADLKHYLSQFKKENRRWKTAGGDKLAIYDEIRSAAKQSLYLSMYNGGPLEMMRRQPGLFPTKAIAEWYQALFFGLFPSVKKWHWRVCEEAERHTYITSPSGFRQYHHDVFRYVCNKAQKRWQKELADESKACIASGPQHMALMFSAHALKRLWETDLKNMLRLTIHDEILMEVPEERVPEVSERLRDIMEMPMKTMPLPPEWGMGEYLRIETEAKMSPVGGAWSEMRKAA